MDREQLARRLMATFLDELEERIASFNRDLLALEKGPAAEEREVLLQGLFRDAHSLKGAARAVEVPQLERVCHELENLLTALQQGKRQLSPPLFALLYRSADAIEDAGQRLREEDPDLEDSPLNEVLDDLQNLDRLEARPEGADGASPAGPEAPARDAATAPQQPTSSPAKPRPLGRPKQRAARSIRVPAAKLHTLSAEAGELLVGRQRISHGLDDLEKLRDAWRREWKAVDARLRQAEADGALDADNRQPLAKQRRLEVTADLRSDLSRIRLLGTELDRIIAATRERIQYLDQVGMAIEEDIYSTRMLPFAEACRGLDRAIRDVAVEVGKQVRLEQQGGDVQIDRSVLERLKDPLLHLVRNAVDHGIESPADRSAAGKPAEATITVAAALRGGSVEVQVRDDGGGINLQRVSEKAAAQGIAIPSERRALARLIFLPAFSTAAKVSDLSGRGVGLDVVRAEIEQLNGSVDIDFQPGQGTCFTLTAPLTLTTIRAVMVQAIGQHFAIPTVSIRRIDRFGQSKLSTVGGRSVLRCGDGAIRVVTSLTSVLGQARKRPTEPDQRMLAVILESGGQEIALVVEEVTSELELNVKSLGSRVRRLKHVSGAALLPSGELALVLNVANLLRTAAESGESVSFQAESFAAEQQRQRLLVVDDSVTSRTLLSSILASAGYDVASAVDGQHALDLLEQNVFDLIVSDVDMPQLDGFQLVEALRNDPRREQLPVVLVTARDSEEDRIRGLQSGANAYVVKSGFDQNQLVQVISDLV